MEHTPGPWYVVVGTSDGKEVCRLPGNGTYADARLIAAAPALLAAAERMLLGLCQPFDADRREGEKQLREAVASARGEG